MYWVFIQPWKVASEREEQRKLIRAGIHDIDQMDGRTFERHLALLFQRLGYAVEQTKATGDFGADLIVERGRERAAVQVKRSAKRVSAKAVQEAVAAKAVYKCYRAIVVTNQGFTKSAEALAVANDVELWDRDRLVAAILSTKSEPNPTGPRPWHPLQVTLLRVVIIVGILLVLLAIANSHTQ